MDEIIKKYVVEAVRFEGIAAPHWQKDFFDHVLRSEESDEEKWHYVRENPVRAGLVKRWQELALCGEIFDLVTTWSDGDSAVIDRRYRKQRLTAAQPLRYDRERCASRRAFCGRPR